MSKPYSYWDIRRIDLPVLVFDAAFFCWARLLVTYRSQTICVPKTRFREVYLYCIITAAAMWPDSGDKVTQHQAIMSRHMKRRVEAKGSDCLPCFRCGKSSSVSSLDIHSSDDRRSNSFYFSRHRRKHHVNTSFDRSSTPSYIMNAPPRQERELQSRVWPKLPLNPTHSCNFHLNTTL